MNRNLSVLSLSVLSVSVLTMGMTVSAVAQAAGPQAPATAPAPAPVAPQAIDAKIALVAFEQAVFATNEGQKAVQDVQKKYEPAKAKIDALSAEVDSLKKQLQAAPATLAEEERASRVRAIEAKEKQLNLDAENANTSYQSDLQAAYGTVAQKVAGVMRNYVQTNGYTLLLDVGGQASNVMWAQQNTDVTQAVVDAYNKSSGVAAPPPSAPSATRPRATTGRPAGTSAPKPAPKP